LDYAVSDLSETEENKLKSGKWIHNCEEIVNKLKRELWSSLSSVPRKPYPSVPFWDKSNLVGRSLAADKFRLHLFTLSGCQILSFQQMLLIKEYWVLSILRTKGNLSWPAKIQFQSP
jgi:hypothetical protein